MYGLILKGMKDLILNNKKDIKDFIIIVSFFPLLLFFYLYIYMDSTFQQKIINPLFGINIEKDLTKADEYIVKDYDKPIVIIFDNFLDVNSYCDSGEVLFYCSITSHGNLVNTNLHFGVKDIEDIDYKVIKINRQIIKTKTIVSSLKGFIIDQRIVNFLDDLGRTIKTEYYDYNELIKYISKNNPKAKIIINQSFFDINYSFNINLLKLDNVYIAKAMPYKGNSRNKNVIELFGHLLNMDNKKLLYVTLCNDYQPTFSKNIVCSNKQGDNSTSTITPIFAYNYFVKDIKGYE